MIVGIKDNKQRELWKFLGPMRDEMTPGNDDGLGIAFMTNKGIYIERWLDNNQAFDYRKPWTQKDDNFKANFEGALEGDASYNFVSEMKNIINQSTCAVIMHTRAASSEVTLKNVHPFYKEGVALIHNGYIGNHDKLTKKYSTCDSETILNSYVDHKVNENPDNITKVADEIRGWYGCGVLAKDSQGKPILDLFRGPNPYLYSTYIDELDAIVFCTDRWNVIEACKKLKWNYGNFLTLKENSMLRIDCISGKKVSIHKFEAKSTYHNETRKYGTYGEWMSQRDKEDLKKEIDQSTVEENRANAEKKSLTSSIKAKQLELDTLKKISTAILDNNDPYLTSRMSYKH